MARWHGPRLGRGGQRHFSHYLRSFPADLRSFALPPFLLREASARGAAKPGKFVSGRSDLCG